MNLCDFNSLEDFVDYVSALFMDKERMITMINQPLFKEEFDYNKILDFLTKGLKVRVGE